MKVVLLGANGRTGRKILSRALEAGDTVTALVRAKYKLADASHERLRVHVGDPCDPNVLAALLPGHDVVISTLGPRWPTRISSAIYPDSATAIVHAMQGSGVNRLLVTSSALLFPSDGLFGRALRATVPRIVEGARRMEEIIYSSGLNWTIARTGFLTNKNTTEYHLATDTLPQGKSSISRVAVASFLLAEASQSNRPRQVVGLSG